MENLIKIQNELKAPHFNHKHGDYKKRLYKIWVGLKHRRYNTWNPTICKEWSDYKNFRKWALCNGYNDELTIDRVDNSKGYSPDNCEWITLQENAGKDKVLLSDDEKLLATEIRLENNFTQREFAEMLSVSRNTIQRADKFTKEYFKL